MKRLLLPVAVLLIASPTYGQVNLGTSTSATNPQRSGDGTTGLFSPASDSVAISSGGTEIMRVNATGIGIGTTSYSNPLSIVTGASLSPISISNTVSTNYTNIAYVGTGRSWFEGVGNASESAIGIPNKWFVYDGTLGATRMVIDTSGNVGVGTTAPLAALDVQNGVTSASGVAYGVRYQQALTASANNDALTALYINPAFTNGSYTGVTNNGLIITGGNVGIGTTSPALLNTTGSPDLSIHNNAGSSGYSELDLTSIQTASGGGLATIDFGTLGNSTSEHRGAAISSELEATSTTNVSANLRFWTTNAGSVAERMRIDHLGNLGIETTTPQATLDVNGFARLALNSSAPATCSSSDEGAIALTHLAQVCVCDTTPAWHILNTSTACSW